MSFFKSLLLAILATIFLTYVLGAGFLQIFDINIVVDNHDFSPIQAISVSAVVFVVLMLVALAIILSVFGGLIFIAVMVIGSIAMAFFGVFWPVLLVACLIYFVSKDKKSTVEHHHYRQYR